MNAVCHYEYQFMFLKCRTILRTAFLTYFLSKKILKQQNTLLNLYIPLFLHLTKTFCKFLDFLVPTVTLTERSSQ